MAMPPSNPRITPLRLNLKKDEKLEIDWADGQKSIYSVSLLRTMCPCAMCRTVRDEKKPQATSSTRLNILPGNFAKPIIATGAELVGNYAIRIEWSDDHGSGIYSFDYLREIAPGQ